MTFRNKVYTKKLRSPLLLLLFVLFSLPHCLITLVVSLIRKYLKYKSYLHYKLIYKNSDATYDN